MNKTKKVFIAVVCIGVVFACTQTEKTEWITSKNVTVAWDAPTSFADGTPIPQNMPLRYIVYVDRDTDKTHDDKEPLTETPI